MSESFKKLKKKYLVVAIIKSLVTGLSCGLLAVGIVLLSLKLSAVNIHRGYYILIGVAVGAAFGTGMFFILKPTDRKAAKYIDREYSLDEKTQTMVAYFDATDEMAAIQRHDTSEKLANLPASRVSFRKIWQYVLIAVLGLALFFTSIGIPALTKDNNPGGPAGGETDDEGDDGTKYEYDLYQQAAMAELLLDINSSNLAGTVKQGYITTLEQLDETLKTVTLKSNMEACVKGAVQLLDGITENANTYLKASAEIGKFDEGLAAAINGAVKVYVPSTSLFNTLRFIKAYELEIGDLIKEVLEQPLTLSGQNIMLQSDTDGGEKLKSYVENLAAAMFDSGLVDTEPLYAGMRVLRGNLSGASSKIGKGYGIGTINDQISGAFTDFKNTLVTVLKEQCYNYIIDVFARGKLGDIFGVAIEPLDEISTDPGNGDGTGGDNQGGDNQGGNSGGGYGEGNLVYGSDDLIFDPETGEYVEYGEILRRYYEYFYERILNGDYKYVNEYFNMLLSGIDNNQD